jgi:hypothetical protein
MAHRLWDMVRLRAELWRDGGTLVGDGMGRMGAERAARLSVDLIINRGVANRRAEELGLFLS